MGLQETIITILDVTDKMLIIHQRFGDKYLERSFP